MTSPSTRALADCTLEAGAAVLHRSQKILGYIYDCFHIHFSIETDKRSLNFDGPLPEFARVSGLVKRTACASEVEGPHAQAVSF